jgi:dimethylglycine dehydrogenase
LPRNFTCAGSAGRCAARRRVRALGGIDAHRRVDRGPASRELLQRLVRMDLGAAHFRLFTCARRRSGFAPAILTRAGFTGELGYEIWTTPDYLRNALRRSVGRRPGELGLVAFRRPRAVLAAARKRLRLLQQGLPPRLHARRDRARSLRGFRKAIYRPRRGAGRALSGIQAALRDHGSRAMRMPTSIGYESIMKDGAAVGYVTSGAYGHCIGKSLAAG